MRIMVGLLFVGSCGGFEPTADGCPGVRGPAPVDTRANPPLAPRPGGVPVPGPLASAYLRRMSHQRALRIRVVLASLAALAGCAIGGGERVGGEPARRTSVVTMVTPFADDDSELVHERGVAAIRRPLGLRVVAIEHNGSRLRGGHDPGRPGRPRRPRDGRRTSLGRVRRTGDQPSAHRSSWTATRFRNASSPATWSTPMLGELPFGPAWRSVSCRAPATPVRHGPCTGDSFRLQGPGDRHPAVDVADDDHARPRRPTPAASSATWSLLRVSPGSTGSSSGRRRSRADASTLTGSHLMTNVNLWPRPLVVIRRGDYTG